MNKSIEGENNKLFEMVVNTTDNRMFHLKVTKDDLPKILKVLDEPYEIKYIKKVYEVPKFDDIPIKDLVSRIHC